MEIVEPVGVRPNSVVSHEPERTGCGERQSWKTQCVTGSTHLPTHQETDCDMWTEDLTTMTVFIRVNNFPHEKLFVIKLKLIRLCTTQKDSSSSISTG